MVHLDEEPIKRLLDWLEDEETGNETEDEEETTSEFVERIVREYSRLGHRSDESERGA